MLKTICLYFRKQNKGYTTTFSDDESHEESETEQANDVVAFTTRIRSKSNVHNDGASSHDELSDNARAKASKMLYLKRIE